jgi:xylulose-5-phosphate/fructose-6-phosphate phosphoketolase
VLDRLPELSVRTAELHQQMGDARLDARRYAYQYGEDPPDVADWTWPW